MVVESWDTAKDPVNLSYLLLELVFFIVAFQISTSKGSVVFFSF